MTKFVGVAKGSRARRLPEHSSASKRVALAMHALTGEHPELAPATDGAAVEAPEPECTQAHVTFALDATPFGVPVVLELYDDRVPGSAREFRARAIGAAGRLGQIELEGAQVVRVAAGLRIDVGATPANASTKPVLEDAALRHDQAGLVSMSLSAPRFSLTLAACPELDGRQQVVGRVVSGLSTVQELSALDADAEQKPLRRALVCSSGTFSSAAAGAKALAVAAEVSAHLKAQRLALREETQAETRARLDRESLAARGAVEDAVQEALKRRKVGPGPGAGRGRMLDALLGGSGSDEDSE
jgi:cyclophilin family peptidyl-prolyl cis-trans isomerase